MDIDGGRWGTAVKTLRTIPHKKRFRLKGPGELSTFGGGDDKECLVLSREFQLPDSSQVVLRVPREHNLYCFNLTNIHSEREIKCLLAKASLDESTKWHRRMAHVNFKNINKLAKTRISLWAFLPKTLHNETNYVATMGLQLREISNTRPLTRPSLQSAPFLSLSSYFIWTFLVLLPSEALITSTIPWWL
ncbi:putative ribonuclease H-like domain-containing protein [Tanacetum coccineum]